MTGIVLSASVRQNLLSLQSPASLLATTQNPLATGNKVNSALDNPTNFFTAQALNDRAGDINNLLDGIGNGVQVLQAANTGITSLQSLVASAQSIANQALQTTVGYSAKSSFSVSLGAGARAGAERHREARLRGVADRGLQRLVGDRLRARDQRLQRGDAGVGGLQHLHAVADAVQEVVDIAGAVVQGLRGEKVGRVVECRVDLVAGGEVILGGGEQRGGRLQREQVLANGR